MRIFYVDDSGNEAFRTFSAVGVPAWQWSTALGNWLNWRRHLREAHGVDARRRLHATDWVAGRGRPSDDPASILNQSKPARWRKYVAALRALAATPDLQVLTVCRPGVDRQATYRILMRWIDEMLASTGEHGLIVVDGENGELRTMHRELDIARIPRRAFMWDWYEQCLGAHIIRDPAGEHGIRGLERERAARLATLSKT